MKIDDIKNCEKLNVHVSFKLSVCSSILSVQFPKGKKSQLP